MSGEPAGGTGKWFVTRTDQELEEILERTPAGSPACDTARDELQRRESKRSEVRQLLWIKATFWTTLLLGVTAIAVALIKH